MNRTLLVLALAACGSDGPAHWNKQPLAPQEGTNDGVTFTIQLPKGMEKSKVESKYDVEFAYHVDGRTYAPSVSVSKASKAKTIGEAMSSENIKAPSEVVFKEDGADFWAFALENSSYKGKEDYVIRAQKKLGDVVLTCNARVYPMTKGGKAKDDIAAVAKMCQSLALK